MQSKLQSSFIYLLPHSCSILFLLLIHAQHFYIFFAIEIWPSLKISFHKAETFNFSNFDGRQYLENSTKTFSTDSLSQLLPGCIFFKCLLPISQLFICPPVQMSAGCSLVIQYILASTLLSLFLWSGKASFLFTVSSSENNFPNYLLLQMTGFNLSAAYRLVPQKQFMSKKIYSNCCVKLNHLWSFNFLRYFMSIEQSSYCSVCNLQTFE